MSEQEERPPVLEFVKIRRELMESVRTLPTQAARASVIYAAAQYVIYGTVDELSLSKPARVVFEAFKPQFDRARHGGITGPRGGNPTLRQKGENARTSNRPLSDF